MFYLFHHMPKCGGTSFKHFLQLIFNLHDDYHTGNANSHPQDFSNYINHPCKLENLTKDDCLAGHYNIDKIRLWERYPNLEEVPHKKFCILRDPLDTAKSGVKFGIKRGWYNASMPFDEKERLLLQRSNYFSKTLGIKDKDHAEEVLEKYWLVAPLSNIDQVANLISFETGNDLLPVPKLNATDDSEGFFPEDLNDKFNTEAELDIHVYNLCVIKFKEQLISSPIHKLLAGNTN